MSDLGEETVKTFREQFDDSSALFLYGDVTDQTCMENVFSEVVRHFGGLDIVINNAGGGGDDVEKTYALNVFALMRCTELALNCMKKVFGGRGGVIVNISSMTALHAMPSGPIYPPSKSAVLSYSLGLAAELGDDHEVQVRVLCPGYVLTEFTAEYKAEADAGDMMKRSRVEQCGGWTELSDAVQACMNCIENKPEPGAAISVSPEGTYQVFPYQMPRKPYPLNR